VTSRPRPGPERDAGGAVVRPLRAGRAGQAERTPPTAVEAEASLVGAVMVLGRLPVEVTRLVGEDAFAWPAHRTIWRTLTALAAQGRPLDPALVTAELGRRGELDDIGGPVAIAHLYGEVPTAHNADHYAREVAAAAALRRQMDLGMLITQHATDRADPALAARYAAELAALAAGQPRDWQPPVPLGTHAALPAFPVGVLPAWLGEYVTGVATATQTPPDLAGMLALAVLAAVAAGTVEVQPRPGWREPLCLFVAVGMDAGARKSGVFTALTRPLVAFERDQAAAALPAITEAATLRRIAEQAAQHAETAAGRAAAGEQADERRAEAIARAAEATNLTVPPVPRWLVDDATPEALAGLLAAHGRIALLSPEGDVFDQMAGRYNQTAGPNLGVYLKGHAGDLLRVDRRGRPPEYVERPCLTIGLTVQPDVLRGLADRPGFRGRGLLARFLYALPASLVGRRQPGAPSVPASLVDRYEVELTTLAASLTTPASLAGDGPVLLTLDPDAAEILLDFEGHLEPRLAAGTGDLGHLAGWAAKLTGATCRLAGLLHLAAHLRDGWARPVDADTFTAAVRLAGYLVEHALAVFDLMGTDPRVDDARWLLDWIQRTGRDTFTRRDAHVAAPRGRFPKASDLDPPLALLEEHGYLRRADPEPPRDPKGRGRPPSPRFLVNPLHPATETTQSTQPPAGRVSVGSVDCVAPTRRPAR
jgi:replicative DNA helicase